MSSRLPGTKIIKIQTKTNQNPVCNIDKLQQGVLKGLWCGSQYIHVLAFVLQATLCILACTQIGILRITKANNGLTTNQLEKQ